MSPIGREVFSNGYKALIAVVALTGATVLAALERISSDAVVALYTAVLGYVFGRWRSLNGHDK